MLALRQIDKELRYRNPKRRSEEWRCHPCERDLPRPQDRPSDSGVRIRPTPAEQGIERSRWILQLQDDWDDEGAVGGYAEVWSRATEFLRSYATAFYDRYGRDLNLPSISPVPNGSIDLHWDYPSYELLINVTRDSAKPVTFYGDDRASTVLKGSVPDTDSSATLLAWLAERS